MTDTRTICSRCVSDTTIPKIRFDGNGVCNFCKVNDKLARIFPTDRGRQQMLDDLVANIKATGRKKKYDCIIGVSGGTDSTYTLYSAKKLGLRPLAVHLNNTWDTEIATENIRKAVEKLEVDFREIHCDWEEFRALQIAFLKASVTDAEIPTDIAIFGVLLRVAAEEGTRYVLNGHSFRTEGIAPIGWTYMDGRYIRSVYKQFTGEKLKHFPNVNLGSYLYYAFLKRIRMVPFLNYFDYSKERAREVLERELEWTYYGGHHFESAYTYFVIVHLLMKKFGVDKRKIGFSAKIRSGQMTRQEALEQLKTPPPVPEGLTEQCIEKLGLSPEQFEAIMQAEPKAFSDYKTYYPLLQTARPFIKVASMLRIISPVLYQKFFS